MALQTKYAELINAAKSANISNLQVREQNNVLYIDGNAPSAGIKEQLWSIYNKLDPDYRTGDLVLNINVGGATASRAKVTTRESNLNIRKGPGTDQEIVGKAAHNDYVTILNKSDNDWWLVKTKDGVQGYAHAQYLTLE